MRHARESTTDTAARAPQHHGRAPGWPTHLGRQLVARNEELLKAVAENQALGRLADAVAYQSCFNQNVLKLATFCDLSNEVLDSGDATLGGVVNRQDATVQQRVSANYDEKELENLVEQIPLRPVQAVAHRRQHLPGPAADGKGTWRQIGIIGRGRKLLPLLLGNDGTRRPAYGSFLGGWRRRPLLLALPSRRCRLCEKAGDDVPKS